MLPSDSADLTARLRDLVWSPSSLRALREVSLASSKDWAALSRWGRREVRLKVLQEVRADWSGSLLEEEEEDSVADMVVV